jgi:hypothetical protein
MWGVVLLSVAVVGAVAVSAADRPIVPTEYGPVRCTTDDKGQVQLCHGIPFAAPPLGDLRYWIHAHTHTLSLSLSIAIELLEYHLWAVHVGWSPVL